MLNKKEVECRDYMMNLFVPTLHKLISSKNPEEYWKWSGNLCRQTAVFGCKFLTMVHPEYDWQAWEGTFDDMYEGKPVKYEHAWIFGKEKETGRRLFLDLSNNVKERLFIETKVNAYPKDSECHADMVCRDRKRLDYEKMISEETEYITKIHSKDLYQEFLKMLYMEEEKDNGKDA